MALQTEFMSMVLMDGRVLVRYLVPVTVSGNTIAGTFVQSIEPTLEAAKAKAAVLLNNVEMKHK